MKFFLPIAALILASFCVAEKESYTGYKLVRITIQNQKIIEKIHSYEHVDREYDVWGVIKSDNGYLIDVMLSPKVFNKYMNIFRRLRVEAKIVHNNVQELFDYQEKTMELTNFKGTSRSIIQKYARYSEIRNFVLDTASANSDIASTYVAGKTTQGRDLTVIKFKTATSRRAIWIDCGIHAREWVTPATCVYVIDKLIQEYRSGDRDTVALLNKYELHILPLYNPDGYEYTYTNKRLWRKNRRLFGLFGGPSVLEICDGVDLNRNADFRWNTGGASSSSCSDIHAGPSGNSENETIAVTNALSANAGNWDAYYSVHSYGNWWLLPWGHDPLDIPPNMAELMENGQIAAAAINSVNGQNFTVGSSSQLLYVTTGSTADWAYGKLDIKFAVTLELRPANGTADFTYGFELPEDRLPEVTVETWAGLKASMLDVSKKRQ